jgi:hypothetical protein
MNKKCLVLGLAMILAAACSPNGYRDESGKVILGPSVFGDDPIHHRPYSDYAEYAVATHEMDDIARGGYSTEQQTCFARVMVNGVPSALRQRLNDYASNKTILMESEFAQLRKDLARYAGDRGFIQTLRPQLDQCLK